MRATCREFVVTNPQSREGRSERIDLSMTKPDRERSLAVFIDLENLAMGFQNQRKIRFEVQKVLERLVEKGKLIVKKAYADWSRYPSYTAPFHESAIELIEIPKRWSTPWTSPGANHTSIPS
jgi:hypothetical protein